MKRLKNLSTLETQLHSYDSYYTTIILIKYILFIISNIEFEQLNIKKQILFL